MISKDDTALIYITATRTEYIMLNQIHHFISLHFISEHCLKSNADVFQRKPHIIK